jgi:hypothetical protein
MVTFLQTIRLDGLQVSYTSGTVLLYICFINDLTTCSLKYHRLHPEYIMTRIEKLGTTYKLRILLIQSDIVSSSIISASDAISQSVHSPNTKSPFGSLQRYVTLANL